MIVKRKQEASEEPTSKRSRKVTVESTHSAKSTKPKPVRVARVSHDSLGETMTDLHVPLEATSE